MLIGIDFDNTIAGYDDVFVSTAVGMEFLQAGEAASKQEVRDRLIQDPNGERNWMRVQGQVYGARMNEAVLIDGVADFLRVCKKSRIPVCIVSHKTQFGHYDENRVDLRDAALMWMQGNGFFEADGFGLSRDAIYFETTREAKVDRIAALGCTHFVDDLMTVFQEPGFPENTRRYLFAPGRGATASHSVTPCQSWVDIGGLILAETNPND